MDNGLRYERKYFTNEANAALIRERATRLLGRDRHSGGKYIVRNLYFDDHYDGAYEEKLCGVMRRKKFRMRHYNDDFGFIRLECKQKEGMLIRKTSAKVTKEQWDAFVLGESPRLEDSPEPVWRECALLARTKGLRPVLRLSYHREAFVYEPGNVRVTIDSALCALPVNGDASEVRAFAPGQCVVELKYDRFLPSVALSLFAGLELRESAVSKYVMAREALWKVWRYE